MTGPATTSPSATGGRQAALRARAADLFPGGVNSPVRAFRSVGRPPLILDAGRGPRVRDADGRWYLDYIGSWGPAILGHGVPAVIEAVREAALRWVRARGHRATRGGAGRADPGGHAVDGADALRVLGHRGGHERHPPRAGRDRSGPRRQVRGRLSRPRRQPPGRRRVRPRDARDARFGRRHRRRGGRHGRPARTTTRTPSRPPSARIRAESPRSSWSRSAPTWA